MYLGVKSSTGIWYYMPESCQSTTNNIFIDNLFRFEKRQVQKSDRINLDCQCGSDQLGSSRIMKKKNVKLNEIETFTHLKVKISVKSGPN